MKIKLREYLSKHKKLFLYVFVPMFATIIVGIGGVFLGVYLTKRDQVIQERAQTDKVLENILAELDENVPRLEHKKQSMLKVGLSSLSKFGIHSPRHGNVQAYRFLNSLDRALLKEMESYCDSLKELHLTELYVIAFLEVGDLSYLFKAQGLTEKLPPGTNRKNFKDPSFRKELLEDKLPKILMEYYDELIFKTISLRKRLTVQLH